jgi:hypothetical protein
MSNVNFNIVIQKMKSRIDVLEKEFGLAVETVNTMMTERIFTDGKSSEGATIGKYDTSHELYVAPSNSPKKLATKGKHGEKVFKTGKRAGQQHKTTYYKSYKDYHDKQAKQKGQGDKVNLVLFGQLQSEFRKPPVKTGENTWVKAISNPANIGKIAGARRKYGDNVFQLSKKERAMLTKLTREAFQKALAQ